MPPLDGLVTEIRWPITQEERVAIRGLGWMFARLDLMDTPHEDAVAMLNGTIEARMQPYVTLKTPEQMDGLSTQALIGVRNEDDGDVTAKWYRRLLNDFCARSRETGHRVVALAASNTDDDTMDWCEDVKGEGWPVNLWGVDCHIYNPEENKEFDRLKKLAGGRPLIIGEYGEANTDPLTPEWQAQRLAELRAFYRRTFPEAFALVLFQYRDGVNPKEREDRYGIRFCDAQGALGDWKPSAYLPNEGDDMSAIGKKMFDLVNAAVIHNADGTKAVRWNLARMEADPGSSDVFSLPPDGRVETRPDTAIGAWESGAVEDKRFLVFRVGDARAVFAYQD